MLYNNIIEPYQHLLFQNLHCKARISEWLNKMKPIKVQEKTAQEYFVKKKIICPILIKRKNVITNY